MNLAGVDCLGLSMASPESELVGNRSHILLDALAILDEGGLQAKRDGEIGLQMVRSLAYVSTNIC